MNLKELLSKDRVILDLKSKDKENTLREMAEKFDAEIVNDMNLFIDDLKKREELSHTVLDSYIATPHAKSAAVNKPAILLGISKDGIDFSNGEEELSKLFFMIAVPKEGGNTHIDILTSISNLLGDEEKIEKLLNANSYEEVISLLEENTVLEEKKIDDSKYVLAVTACPTGIAHTFMAKDALEKAAKELGVKIKVETNGSDGRKNELTKEDMDKALGIILAINKSVNEERFNGYNVIKVGAKDGISRAKELITDVLNGNTKKANFEGISNSENNKDKKAAYNHLLTGVSYMLPLVVAGGILIALAFLFDSLAGNSNTGSAFGSTSPLAKTLMNIGGSAFGLFVPILAGYVAFSIGDKAALAAGLVAGKMAADGGSGFLGALIGGIFAGYLTKIYLNKTKNLNRQFQGINLILFTPVISVLLVGLVMIFALNPVVGTINTNITLFLENMSSGSKIVLGLLLGGMMAVDMGGPINKAAYVFGTGTLAATANMGGSSAMAAVMAGGMVPPLAIALATTIFKNKYSKEEQEAGLSNYVMGLSFITEGAIPFAAAAPTRVIPPIIIGSSIAGALTMFYNIKIPAPHGGILVMFLSNNFLLYLVSIVVGSIIAAILLGLLKEKK